MAVFKEPNQWEHPLGNNADTSTLPDDAVATAGIASLQKLFQIINATPLEAGGIAPGREDVNALFKYLGDQIFYTQNGGVPSYNAAYDYIAGRVVSYNDNIYKCIQANGASSTVVAPDSVSPAGSDYWVQVATLADFANFANTDLSNLSASGRALFTNKADTDLSNVPSSKGILVKSYINGASWYRVYSDGYCEQGGLATVATDTYNYAVSFIKPFIDNNVNVLTTVTTNIEYQSNVGSISINGAVERTGSVNRISASGFYINLIGSNTRGYGDVSWRASGYIS